jgi:predicted enzyme related to lactoylglutathione lyase
MGMPVVWFEVMGHNGDALRGFYSKMFGWEYTNMPGMDYGMVDKPEAGIPGGIGTAPEGPGWVTFYVGVTDMDAALETARSLGSTVLMAPHDLPGGGQIAMISDPEGRPIGLARN